MDAFSLFLEQTSVLSYKHFSQKRRAGRTTLKEVIVTPFFLFLFTGVLMIIASNFTPSSAVYALHGLPALNSDVWEWGIFNQYGYIDSTHLYYSPSGNAGVDACK